MAENKPAMDERVPIRVGVIVNNVGGYSRGVLRGVANYAFSRTWTCRVQGVNAGDIEADAAEFDGLIVQAATPDQAQRLSKLRLPVVNVSSALGERKLPSVVSDDGLVGRLGAEHFLRGGYRSLAFYSIDARQFAIERREGFCGRLREAGFQATVIQDKDDLVTKMKTLAQPLAVMGGNDRAALAVLDACRASGLRVPDDVAVLGVDNDDLVQAMAYPPLSSINTARERIGFEAAAMLERLMRGEKMATRTVLIAPKGVVVRRSTDALAIHDRDVAEAVRYINAHAGRTITVDDVAREVTISRRQLERRFRAALERTVLDEITRCRIDRARLLLADTDLTLEQIAMASGFTSPAYFNVVFKRSTGTTPGAFRGSVRRGAPMATGS